MSKEERKYRRQEHARKDLQQCVFFQDHGNGETDFKVNPSKYAVITEKGIDPFKTVTCPFCLGINKLQLFLISTKKGVNRSQGKCPLCGNGARLQTLIKMTTWTPEQYAGFVYPYAKMGFWQKIQKLGFDTWKRRLKLMGWAQAFWNEYKRLRGDLDREAEEKRYEEEWTAYEASFQ